MPSQAERLLVHAILGTCADDKTPQISIGAKTLDGVTHTVNVKENATLEHISTEIAHELGIKESSLDDGRDFCFFQKTEGLETYRMLPNTSKIAMILQKWERLRSLSGRESSLVWKRRNLYMGETLQVQ